MAFPIIDGISLLHWHLNRGKKSIVLDLKTTEGIAVYKELVRGADAVIEGMRPGVLARRGLGYEDLKQVNPKIVFCTHSGYGMTGPYKDMPSHGIAYDAWAGVARPSYDANGFPTIPSYTTIGINAGPLYAALGICAAIIRARATGQGCYFEVAQSDAAAAFNWNGIEGNKAYERPEDEVTGNDGDGKGPRRPGRRQQHDESVRYQYYRSKDGLVLFMASEREFWKNFCEGIGRPELFEQNPGAKYADHARGQRRAPPRAGLDLRHPHHRGVGRVLAEGEHDDLSGERREVDHEGPALPGAPLDAPVRGGGNGPHAVADQADRRVAARAVGRRARARARHRHRHARRARLRRREDRGPPRRGNVRVELTPRA
jgi:hypothetical protein